PCTATPRRRNAPSRSILTRTYSNASMPSARSRATRWTCGRPCIACRCTRPRCIWPRRWDSPGIEKRNPSPEPVNPSNTGCRDPRPGAPGADLIQPSAIPGVELRVPALGRDRLAIEEQRQARRRRLEEMAGGDHEVGALAGLERADLLGDPEDPRRGERDGLE